MLTLHNIVKTYGDPAAPVPALKGVSLSFRDCEFVSILGPSGCGKTTMLNIIGGLDRYTDGDLIIRGRSTKEFGDRDWDAYRNHSVGFVFQSYNLIPHQSVLANVELALTLSGVGRAERRSRAKQALERVGLGDQLSKRPNQMSGGQMQRVTIARALVNDPDIVLADEPTGALDSETSVSVMELLKEVSRDRLVIMVTHNRELAEQYSTRIVSVLDGQITGDTDPYDASEEESGKDREKSGKRLRSMSALTALSLSLKNLMTKRTRTLLTSFAGSIGIIGIALILAMSTGINAYIDGIQRDTLSSYPIMLEKEHTDLSSLLTSMTGAAGETGEAKHEKDAVYSTSRLYDMLNALINAEVTENNLSDFRDWLEKQLADGDSEASEIISSVHYTYNVPLNTYVLRGGEYIKTDLTGAFSSMMRGNGGANSGTYSSMRSGMSTVSLWEELLPGTDGSLISPLIREQYDLLCGRWPESRNEILLRVDDNNEISDLGFYAMGLMEDEEVMEIFSAVMNREEIDTKSRVISYDDALGMRFRVLPSCDAFTDSDGDGLWEDIREDGSLLDMTLRSADELSIVGVIRQNEDVIAASQSGTFLYTAALTDYLREHTRGSAVYKAMSDPANENLDLFSGLPFVLSEEELTAPQKAAEFRDYVDSLDDEGKTGLLKQIRGELSDDDLNMQLDAMLAQYDSREKLEEMIASGYGQDSATVSAYLASYSDDELTELVRENAADMLRQNARNEADAAVDALLTAPSEEKLAEIMDAIRAQLTTRETKMGYVMTDWSEKTTLSRLVLLQQLQMMTDDQLDEAVTAVARGTAELMAAKYTTGEPDFAVGAAALADELADADEARLADCYDRYMPSAVSSSTLKENLRAVGASSLDTPVAINVYATTFENKDRIADLIAEYNASAAEEDVIEYTDYVALLMSGITDIINAISYALIVFVSVSLVVSSIMIGIITYISVLERTKEIGVLRAIGASKGDIRRVFNAETLLVGLCAGLLGIGVSLLLCIPISLIVHHLTNINTINAFLYPSSCVALVCISMLLTVIAGLIPSGMAARLDPVNALRSE